MDPESAAELRDILSSNNARLKHQEEQIMATGHVVQALVAQVSDLTNQFQQLKTDSAHAPTVPNPPHAVPPADHSACFTEPRLPPPAAYSGEPQLCHFFLAKCSLFFALQPSSFPTEESKVTFVITLLSGQAALCGNKDISVAHHFSPSTTSSKWCLMGQSQAERQPECWWTCVKVTRLLLIIPLSSACWLQSVIGKLRHGGTCFWINWPTVSKIRSTCWNYPLH